MGVSVLGLVGPIMYYPDMASIVGKKRGNKTYYYLVTSARVGAKPRTVDQQYVGSAEEVMARLSGAPAGAPDRRAITAWALPRYCGSTMRGLAPTRAEVTR